MKTDTIKKRQRYESGPAGGRKIAKRSRDDDDLDDYDDSTVPSLDIPIKQEHNHSSLLMQHNESVSPLDSTNPAFVTYTM